MHHAEKADGVATGVALSGLPTTYHLSGPCQPTQLFGEVHEELQGLLRPCWVPASSATFKVTGLDYAPPFNPDFVWVVQGEATDAMRGGRAPEDLVPWATRSFAYIGFCHTATVQLGFPARVQLGFTRWPHRGPQ